MEIYCGESPLVGGFWERLIRSVKRSLRKSIGRSNLTYEQLSTLIVEVEAVINSRPLTYIADDCDGISGCLSPSLVGELGRCQIVSILK